MDGGAIEVVTGTTGGTLAEFGQAANKAAAAAAFADYRSRKAKNTLRRQDSELANFGDFLGRADLTINPAAWQGVTWGLVEAYLKQMLVDGYAVGTANNHLSTIKTYAKLAAKAGAVSMQELAMIRMVSGYSHKEGVRIDEKREDAGMDTRIGNKKEDFKVLSEEQAALLKAGCDLETPQGRRDRVLLVLLLDLGLRVSEAEGLQADAFDPETGTLHVYRPKTDTTTRFELRNGKRAALVSYYEEDTPSEQLLQGSRRGGTLMGGMSKRAIRARIRKMGEGLGIDKLSPHDLRHTRATHLAKSMNVRELMDFFGWNSPAMAARYIESVNHITVE
jgi:integrase